LFRVSGFGASADAVHITAPDRSGAGLVRAARAALADAACEPSRVGLVSAHATSTPFNDGAEAKALRELFDPLPLVHPFKAQIGHTLGAAGVLELLAATHALEEQVAPAAAGDAPLDPEATVPMLEHAEPRRLDAALKLAAAFGGVTAALVAQREPSNRRPRPLRAVRVVGHAAVGDVPIDRVALADATGVPRDKLARIDDLGQLALAATAALASALGREALNGAGVVAGYALATLATNEIFNRRLIDKGPRWVDPRLFPATTPNSGAGHVAIAFGLTGPNFAVNGGLNGGLEAVAAAAELVAAGDADRMLVIAADDAGPAARSWVELVTPDRAHARGAVALLLEAGEPGALDLDMPIEHHRGAIGHLPLLEWLKSR
jgi:3-oxoacyl-[acyl-carrier-protein] synthase-1/3-oxoacyl-[acyl-carrier-protein] synthase II